MVLLSAGLRAPTTECEVCGNLRGAGAAVDEEEKYFAIRSEGRLAGSIGVAISRPVPGAVEVGYWIAPHARRQGTALRAVLLVAGHILAVEGVERLEILCHPGNWPSRHVAERAGAQFEGIRRGGLPPSPRRDRTDAAVYALMAGEVPPLRPGEVKPPRR